LQQRAIAGIGRIRRPDQVGERAELVSRLDNAFIGAHRRAQPLSVQRRDLPPVGGGEIVGERVRARDVRLDLRIVHPGIQIAQVPQNIFGTGSFLVGFDGHSSLPKDCAGTRFAICQAYQELRLASKRQGTE